MSIFDNILGRNKEIEWMYDFELFEDLSTNAYLKTQTLNVCIEFIARAIAQSEFKVLNGTRSIKEDIYYKLNVKPNTDMSSDTFWQRFIYKLIYDNKVLVITTDTNDLVIADDYERVEFGLYDDIFRNVVVKDYKYQRTFKMDEVIYLEYNNLQVEKIVEGLFRDYGDIFGRMIQTQLRNNQIRGLFRVDNTNVSDENRRKMEAYRDKLFKSFSNSSVAIVPIVKGFEYEELKNAASGNLAISEMTEVKKNLISDVALAIGIPPGLINGDSSDLDKNIRLFEEYCLKPLIKKLQNELNAKLFTKKEYLKGKRIEIYGIGKKNPLEHAEAVDKLVSSGSFTRNEVRIMLGAEPSEDPELDQFLITKNYEKTTKGGE